jgi:hypothetical protein
MKLIAACGILILMSLTSYGQDKAAMQKIESARIALITERLELTPSQAEKFWPLYREYNLQRRQMREEFRNTRQSVDRQNLSEEQSRELMQKVMDLKQQELNLEKKYATRMTQVISTQQMLRLRNAEKDFQQMIAESVFSNGDSNKNQNQKMMQRREMLRDRNNN